MVGEEKTSDISGRQSSPVRDRGRGRGRGRGPDKSGKRVYSASEDAKKLEDAKSLKNGLERSIESAFVATGSWDESRTIVEASVVVITG
ncbi:hypothetical protein E4U44_004620 [Claviceps purpurea]|nr:hypothetical protein E4U44_004620 [Claviceps purpurea]